MPTEKKYKVIGVLHDSYFKELSGVKTETELGGPRNVAFLLSIKAIEEAKGGGK